MTSHRHPGPPTDPPPTPRQLRYLRALAQRTGRTFVPPTTKAEASRAIDELMRAPRSTRVERFLEAQPTPPPAATTVHDDEITGYGWSTRWRHTPPPKTKAE